MQRNQNKDRRDALRLEAIKATTRANAAEGALRENVGRAVTTTALAARALIWGVEGDQTEHAEVAIKFALDEESGEQSEKCAELPGTVTPTQTRELEAMVQRLDVKDCSTYDGVVDCVNTSAKLTAAAAGCLIVDREERLRLVAMGELPGSVAQMDELRDRAYKNTRMTNILDSGVVIQRQSPPNGAAARAEGEAEDTEGGAEDTEGAEGTEGEADDAEGRAALPTLEQLRWNLYPEMSSTEPCITQAVYDAAVASHSLFVYSEEEALGYEDSLDDTVASVKRLAARTEGGVPWHKSQYTRANHESKGFRYITTPTITYVALSQPTPMLQ